MIRLAAPISGEVAVSERFCGRSAHRDAAISARYDDHRKAFLHPAGLLRAAVPVHTRWITFRAGVNLGDISVDGSDIFGAGVNVAARLAALAGTRRDPSLARSSRAGTRQDRCCVHRHLRQGP